MKTMILLAIGLLALPPGAAAATRTYDTREFSSISVSTGITVEITLGARHHVVAETEGSDFDSLRIRVKGDVLHIDRPPGIWLRWFGRRPDYHVRVEAPALQRLSASSGSAVTVQGESPGDDFEVNSSSGSRMDIHITRGRAVRARGSSGSRLNFSGNCSAVRIIASSGSRVDAEDLRCRDAEVQASSGSSVTLAATGRVAGSASSGSNVKVRGAPAVVEVKQSTGADVVIHN
jgi:hypothetical protein